MQAAIIFIHTKTVAMFLGKVFARIEKEAVIAAEKPIASTARTKKHSPMNIGPSGALSNSLKTTVK